MELSRSKIILTLILIVLSVLVFFDFGFGFLSVFQVLDELYFLVLLSSLFYGIPLVLILGLEIGLLIYLKKVGLNWSYIVWIMVLLPLLCAKILAWLNVSLGFG